MNTALSVISEAVEIIKEHRNDSKVIIEQCNLIIKYAKEIKDSKNERYCEKCGNIITSRKENKCYRCWSNEKQESTI